MSLADIIRNGVAIANRQTAALQAEVTHEPWIGSDKFGKAVYDHAIKRPAIVEYRTRGIGTQQLVQNASVTFIYPILPNGAANRQEPIDPRDKITLPDGWSGPIVDVNGMVDPSTGMPYMYTVALGDPGGVS